MINSHTLKRLNLISEAGNNAVFKTNICDEDTLVDLRYMAERDAEWKVRKICKTCPSYTGEFNGPKSQEPASEDCLLDK